MSLQIHPNISAGICLRDFAWIKFTTAGDRAAWLISMRLVTQPVMVFSCDGIITIYDYFYKLITAQPVLIFPVGAALREMQEVSNFQLRFPTGM